MNSIFYELQRTFRSKFVLIMMGIIILVAALIAYLLASGPASVPVSQRSITDEGLFNGVDSLFGFLIPILAIFMGYFTYGKDRTSGVLESVVTRPVTKSELLVTRFIASIIAILIAVVISVMLVDAGQMSYFRKGMPANMIAALIWIYFVEGASFIGLIYLFAHLVKSQSSLLGLAIALFIVFSLLWSTVSTIVLVEVFHGSISSLSTLQGQINFNFASPSGYGKNVAIYVTHLVTLTSIAGTNIRVNPASYGITELSVGAIGIIWMAVPILLAFLLARKRD